MRINKNGSTKIRLIQFRHFNPRRNLPDSTSRGRKEIYFAGAFERAFLTNQKTGIGGKQFAIEGYGIADFIWLTSERIDQEINTPLLYAFEIKMVNWKKALQQAFRYSYYADRAIVVLPVEVGNKPSQCLNIFKELNVGLWLFERTSNIIHRLFTPEIRPQKPIKAREKAFSFLAKRTDFGHFPELANAFA